MTPDQAKHDGQAARTGRFATDQYAALLAKGCLCGTGRPADCEIHGPSDNRGLRAFYEAGLPLGFPYEAFCIVCGAEGLMYPDVELDDPQRGSDGPPTHRPTLICPRCSRPTAESALRSEASDFGYELNDRTVFGVGAAAA